MRSLVLPSLVLAGCACGDGSPVLLTDSHNYQYAGTIDVPVLTTAAGTDITLCWDQVVTDLQCHTVDPAQDIDSVAIIRFNLTREEVEDGLTRNNLQQSQVTGYLSWENTGDQVCTSLSTMTFLGTVVDVTEEYTPEGGTYLLTPSTGTTIGQGVRALAFLVPDATSSVTEVSVPDTCGTLQVDPDLTSLTPAGLCAEEPWTLDWSAVTRDAQGNEFQSSTMNNLMLAWYEGLTAADLEARFLDLEVMATATWELDLGGATSADLADALSTADGTPFAGFEGEGTWGVALRNTYSYNPAPAFLTLLDVQE